jgi:hypothetical protein
MAEKKYSWKETETKKNRPKKEWKKEEWKKIVRPFPFRPLVSPFFFLVSGPKSPRVPRR